MFKDKWVKTFTKIANSRLTSLYIFKRKKLNVFKNKSEMEKLVKTFLHQSIFGLKEIINRKMLLKSIYLSNISKQILHWDFTILIRFTCFPYISHFWMCIWKLGFEIILKWSKQFEQVFCVIERLWVLTWWKISTESSPDFKYLSHFVSQILHVNWFENSSFLTWWPYKKQSFWCISKQSLFTTSNVCKQCWQVFFSNGLSMIWNRKDTKVSN